MGVLPLVLTLLARADVSLADLARFPPAEVAAARYQFAYQHCFWLRQRRAALLVEAAYQPFASTRERMWNGVGALDVWYREAEYCRDCWYHLAGAGNLGEPYGARILALRQLRKAVGWRAYLLGAMPAAAPVQRFYWRE